MFNQSLYCADCLCGQHFETSSREWTCTKCGRLIMLKWGWEPESDANKLNSESETVPEAAA